MIVLPCTDTNENFPSGIYTLYLSVSAQDVSTLETSRAQVEDHVERTSAATSSLWEMQRRFSRGPDMHLTVPANLA